MNRILSLSVTLLLFSIIYAYGEESTPIKMEGKLVDVELTIEPYPIEPEKQTKLDIRFVEKGSNKTQVHIDYVVTIINANGNEVFRTPLTHTNEGEIIIPFVFLSEGGHTIRVEIQGILFQPIPIETVDFTINVVPEFPLGALVVFSIITIIGITIMRKSEIFRI